MAQSIEQFVEGQTGFRQVGHLVVDHSNHILGERRELLAQELICCRHTQAAPTQRRFWESLWCHG
ncbi:hypothetical protein AB0K14_11045 [Actinosynnema sp. NPDC050801]|uniref:hypothetical protein n=1 Tax=unclassified Actinosynnema TaxID=2637065 RepID=UPI0033E239DC